MAAMYKGKEGNIYKIMFNNNTKIKGRWINTTHPYHLVDVSPWPILMSFAL